MKLLVVAATAPEIAPFLQNFRSKTSAPLQNKELDVLITGVGMLPAAYHIARHITLRRPHWVVQAGIAGSFSTKLKPGEVVVVKSDTIADMLVKEKKGYRSVFDMGLIDKNRYPFEKGFLPNRHPFLKQLGWKKVKAITVNQITTQKNLIAYYNDTYRPALESMEGAALHYVCSMEHIPFLQLRSISNMVGERNKQKWCVPLAIEQLNQSLLWVVEQLLMDAQNK